MTNKIKETRNWTWSAVRMACINNEYYDLGDCQEYENLASFVCSHKPTMSNLLYVAEDIKNHTYGELDVLNVMEVIANEAVKTVYEINE